MKNFHIPKPCSEDWESMSPEEKGRFCSVCSKTVIDFTQKQPHEIQQIMEEKKGERVCGKFFNHQLKVPRSPELKNEPSDFQNNKIALSIFSSLLFLTGCSKPKEEVYTTTGLTVILEEDSALVNNQYALGEAAIVESNTIAKIPQKDKAVIPKNCKKK